MRKSFVFGMLTLAGMAIGGCARPGEIGWSPAHSMDERHRDIARNWDMEGKMLVEDIDHALLLRPMSSLSYWHIR